MALPESHFPGFRLEKKKGCLTMRVMGWALALLAAMANIFSCSSRFNMDGVSDLLHCTGDDVVQQVISRHHRDEVNGDGPLNIVVRDVELDGVGYGHILSSLEKCVGLTFQSCRFAEGSLANVLSTCILNSPKIRWIALHHCAVDSLSLAGVLESIDAASTAPNTALCVLDLSHNALDSSAIHSVCGILQAVSSIHTLSLDMNELGLSELRALKNGMKRDGALSLRTLSLSSCGLKDDSMAPILKILNCQEKLRCLDLSGNGLGVDAMERLASAFRKGVGRGLEELDLSYTKLGDAGCRVLTHALRSGYLPNLRSLKICGIGATGRALDTLLAVSMDNEAATGIALEHVDISGNDLFPVMKKEKGGSSSAKAIPKKFMAAMKTFGAAGTLMSSLESLSGKKQAKRYHQRALTYGSSFKSKRKGEGEGGGKDNGKSKSRVRNVEHIKVSVSQDTSLKLDAARQQERRTIKTLAEVFVAMATATTPGDSPFCMRDLHLNRVGLTDSKCLRLSKQIKKLMDSGKETAMVTNGNGVGSISIRLNNLPDTAISNLSNTIPTIEINPSR